MDIDVLLKSRKTEDRLRAVQMLASRRDPETIPALITALDDRSAYVAQLAVEGLSEIAGHEHGAALMAAFERRQAKGIKRDPGCYIRTAIAYALARLEHHPADDIMRQGLNTVQVEPVGGVATDTACQLRAACALALAEMRARNALADITPLLFDVRLRIDDPAPNAIRNYAVRKSAATALSRLGDRAGIVPLTIKLMFPGAEEADVLAECMAAALVLDPEQSVKLMLPYLTGSNSELIAHAATIYARSGASDAVDRVATAAGRLSGDNLRAVILTLATMRTDEAFERLYDFAASPKSEERLAFIEAITITGDVHAKPLLEALASDDASPKVREAAKNALEKFRSPND